MLPYKNAAKQAEIEDSVMDYGIIAHAHSLEQFKRDKRYDIAKLRNEIAYKEIEIEQLLSDIEHCEE